MKLAIETKPFCDESLQSWLIRNSFANGSDSKSFYIAIWKKYNIKSLDLDKHLPQVMIDNLAKITRLSVKEIISLTLKPYLQTIIDTPLNPYGLWYFLIPLGKRGSHQTNGMHFCPLCLDEPIPYLKKQWRLAWNVGCSIHKTKLVNKCPKCNIVFSPQFLTYDIPKIYICSSCGFDLRNIKTGIADSSVLLFQEILNEIVFQQKTVSFPALQTQSVQDLFAMIRTLVPFFQYTSKIKKYNKFFEIFHLNVTSIKEEEKPRLFERMNVKNRELFLKLIFQFLRSDSEKIKELLEQLKAPRSIFSAKISSCSPTILYFSESLEVKKHQKTSKKTSNIIKPNSKEEVDLLFSEIIRHI